ncbi:MAG: DUF484 family protein [Paracoccaceae bacterium]|nr:DUF484 family protein [Paracoccaceae bacterium]
MSSTPKIDNALREAILSQPDVILEDSDVMRALVAANERSMGANVVDLRGIAMDRMEGRLDRLENTHRSVIAAAYENLAGTNQVHRAILSLVDCATLEDLLRCLDTDIKDTLRLDAIKLVAEVDENEDDAVPSHPYEDLAIAKAGFVDDYLAQSRQGTARIVTLRHPPAATAFFYGETASQIKSEACLVLDFGPDRLPGLLVMGSQDPDMFAPQQGSDLLVFFAGVFERVIRRFLT